jgi:hypothetical protein
MTHAGGSNMNYIIELPIEPNDAKRRKIRADLAKLLIKGNENADNKESEFFKFAELIYSFCSQNQVVHANPINSFSHVDEYKVLIENSHIPSYWFDSAFMQGHKKRPTLLTAECHTVENIYNLFKIIRSEAMVFFLAKDSEKDMVLEEKLFKGRPRHYENPYLEEIDRYKYFIFFAESHMSLEILGFEEFILTCLMKALEMEGRLPK